MFKCRLCSAEDVSVKYSFATCRVGYCRKCSLVQVLEKPSKDSLLKLYDVNYFKRGKYVQDRAIAKENRRRISWLKQNGLERGARVLEVGCATGDFLKSAGQQFDMWGLDISEFAVEQARLNNPEISGQIKAGLVEEQIFPDNFFDGIVLWDVIGHLWDPVGVVGELTKMLKPGGILAISTPNIGTFSARIMGKHWHFMVVPEQLCFFNRNTINLLLKTVGLKSVNWMTKGKWVNIGFLLYKANKMFPKILLTRFLRWLQQSKIVSFVVYVPTGDVQYIAATRS